MIFRLEIENFYSIREPQIIDLSAAENAPDQPGRLEPAWPGAPFRAPKVVAAFGPNAAGKSNILRALAFIAWFAKDSFALAPNNRLPYERFNDIEALEAPTRLVVHLAGAIDPAGLEQENPAQCAYMYELVLGGPSTEIQHVIREALYYWPAGKKTRLFERDEAGSVTAAKAFDLAGYRQALEKVLRPSVSVISTLAQLKHQFSLSIWDAASRVLTNILIERQDGPEDQMIRHYAANPALIEVLNRELERIDLGLRGMEIVQGPSGPAAMFTHEGLTHKMPLIYESHGTRNFVKIFPIVLHALETGGVAILDELDATIHPLILPEILRWFHSSERNKYGAQLWMSCHNASLLEDLTKEEILFCEKDAKGQTRVYGLRDIQNVRRTDNYYRKYLGGVYGAVPNIG